MTDQDKQDSILDSLPEELRPIAREMLAHSAGQRTEWIETKSIVEMLGTLHYLGYRLRSSKDARAAEIDNLAGQDGPSVDLQSARSEAEQILRTGEPFLAYNLAEQALSNWEGDLRLRQLAGLALARAGAVDRANKDLQGARRRRPRRRGNPGHSRPNS